MSQVDTPEGRQWLKDLLKEREVIVTFTKVNGEERVMTCTLNESVVPATVASDDEINRNRKVSEQAQVVWDINAQGWRSFRWANVKEVQFTLGE